MAEKKLEDIEYAMCAEGRHCFINGDRGIGKSSLAHTAASQLQSSEKRHLGAGCNKTSTFISVINSLVNYANNQNPMVKYEKQSNRGFSLSNVSGESSNKTTMEFALSYDAGVDKALEISK